MKTWAEMQADAKGERQSPAPEAPSTGSKKRHDEKAYRVWMEWTIRMTSGEKHVRAFCAKKFATEMQARDYAERQQRCYGKHTTWWVELNGERIDG